MLQMLFQCKRKCTTGNEFIALLFHPADGLNTFPGKTWSTACSVLRKRTKAKPNWQKREKSSTSPFSVETVSFPWNQFRASSVYWFGHKTKSHLFIILKRCSSLVSEESLLPRGPNRVVKPRFNRFFSSLHILRIPWQSQRYDGDYNTVSTTMICSYSITHTKNGLDCP